MMSLTDLLAEQIKDLYSAESQLVKALPKMIDGAHSPQLREALESHLKETKVHVERLSQIADGLGIRPGGKKCKGMEGLLEEGKEALEEEGDDAVLDAAIIAAAQRVEHYEISGYGTAHALAELLGHTKAARTLSATLSEERKADEALTQVCVKHLYPTAPKEREGAAAGKE